MCGVFVLLQDTYGKAGRVMVGVGVMCHGVLIGVCCVYMSREDEDSLVCHTI